MSADNSPKQALQDSLTRLAHSFQANETTISVEQIAECFRHLHDTDRTALNRLFCLIYQDDQTASNKKHVSRRSPSRSVGSNASSASSKAPKCTRQINNGHVKQSSTITAQSALRKAAARARSSTSRQSARSTRSSIDASSDFTSASDASDQRHSEESRIVQGRQFADRHSPSPSPHPNDCTGITALSLVVDPLGAPDSSPTEAFALSSLGLDGGVEASSRQITTAIDACDGKLKFSATMESLLQVCTSDPSAFLRAVADGKVSLPNGQGWEAAMATKRNNADLRELTRIFHRFECYNIYQHVVDAGHYHTGSHWIRDMRPLLAEKLSRDFPECFVDRKAANKCLNWVDQGCRYRDWAEQLSDPGTGTNLGYLIAMPCDVPHSTYTSRCTKEQIASTVVELKNLGIREIVDKMKLSSLANQIIESLHEMTSGKRKAVPETQLSVSRRPCHAANVERRLTSAVRLDQSLTPPDLTMFDASQYTFDAFTDSWLEDWTMEDTNGSAVHAYMAVDPAPDFQHSPFARTDPRSPASPNPAMCSPSTLTATCNEWYQQ